MCSPKTASTSSRPRPIRQQLTPLLSHPPRPIGKGRQVQKFRTAPWMCSKKSTRVKFKERFKLSMARVWSLWTPNFWQLSSAHTNRAPTQLLWLTSKARASNLQSATQWLTAQWLAKCLKCPRHPDLSASSTRKIQNRRTLTKYSRT